VEHYPTLWHDNFVGWPRFAVQPSDKSNIGGWVKEIREQHRKLTHQLQPKAARVFGAVTQAAYVLFAVMLARAGWGRGDAPSIIRSEMRRWVTPYRTGHDSGANGLA